MTDNRTFIASEHAIKPYYYVRNGILHARYTVDRAIELSKAEEETIKTEITKDPANKQFILSDKWHFLEHYVFKPVIMDGINASVEKTRHMTELISTKQE